MLRESGKRSNAMRRLIFARAVANCVSVIHGQRRTVQRHRPGVLQHLVPFARVFEHDFAEETNGRHAVVEQFVVEFLQ